ncbi:MAG: 4Fe-4S binding protein [Deltaproteobacteria bacterium]|jgi:ferredoxin|nr:4Fe-4S binding protein [Deltaproteobacteria bacterium]
MKPIIHTDNHLCVACNKCARACPIPLANVVTQDSGPKPRVSIDYSRCVGCGACLKACDHGARAYRDDLQRFLQDLRDGKAISIIVASANALANFPDLRRVFAWLKSLGARDVYDSSLGADIYAWANVRHIERFRPFSVIASYCPAVTRYCQTQNPALLPRLAPIHGPMTCQAIYLKERLRLTDAIAAFTPCVAATQSASESRFVEYNVTFRKLWEYVVSHNVPLPEEEADFDPLLGLNDPQLPPISAGLRHNLDFFVTAGLRVDQASGPGVYALLEEYAAASPDRLPPVFSVLNCERGCALGTGANPQNGYFQAQSVISQHQRSFAEEITRDYYVSLFKRFDETVDLELFTRDFSDESPARESVSEARIEEAFRLLGKSPLDQRSFNCGFCGSSSCREMAEKIALKINVPANCVTQLRQAAENATLKSESYIELIHSVSEYLLTTVGEDFNESVEHALMALCYAMDGVSASLWKNVYDFEEKPRCHRVVTFPGMIINPHFNTVTLDDPPGWLETLVEGNNITRLKSNMTRDEQRKFLGRNVNSLVLAPIVSQGDFWGFVSLLKQEEVPFSERDVSVISICSNLLASYMINLDLQGNFLDEESLSL